jgi:hypothetical protein
MAAESTPVEPFLTASESQRAADMIPRTIPAKGTESSTPKQPEGSDSLQSSDATHKGLSTMVCVRNPSSAHSRVVSDADHDRVWRQAMVQEMTAGSEQMYSADETGAIAEGLSLFAAVRTGEGKTRAAKHKSTVDWARTKHHEHSGLMIGETQAMVRGFCQDIVAYLVHFDSRHFASDSGIGRTFAVLERKNLHHIVTFMEFRQHVFRTRTFVNSVVWQQISDRPLTYVVVAVPCDHQHLAPLEQARRGQACVTADAR